MGTRRPSRFESRSISDDNCLRGFRVRGIYSVGELSALFSASTKVVREILDSGELKSSRIGNQRHRRVGHKEVKRWLRARPEHWYILERLLWAEKLEARRVKSA